MEEKTERQAIWDCLFLTLADDADAAMIAKLIELAERLGLIYIAMVGGPRPHTVGCSFEQPSPIAKDRLMAVLSAGAAMLGITLLEMELRRFDDEAEVGKDDELLWRALRH